MKAFFRNYITGCRKEIAAVLLCSLFCSLLTVGCSGIMNRIVEETLGSAQDGDGTLLFSLTGSFHLPGKKAVRLAGASDFPENPSGCDGKADAAAV